MSTQQTNNQKIKNNYQMLFELVLFPMFAAMMFVSKLLMEALPNVHLLGMFTILLTVIFRAKALIPIYIYVFLNGLYAGFNIWWVPYLYIWTVLWGLAMLIPKRTPRGARAVIYPVLCALHGLAYGILYAPAQALFFGLDFGESVAWIISGIPFDVTHCIGNFAAGLLVLPLEELMKKLMRRGN